MKIGLNHFLLVLGLLFASHPAVASMTYAQFEGGKILEGNGGAKVLVNGVEIWTVGTPPRKFKIIGILDDSRGTGIFSGNANNAIADKVKGVGGDAAILVSSDVQAVGSYTTPSQVQAQTNFGITTATVYGGQTMTVSRQYTRAEVIKYVGGSYPSQSNAQPTISHSPKVETSQPATPIPQSVTPTPAPLQAEPPTAQSPADNLLADKYRSQAIAGDMQSSLSLGLLYLNGQGVPKDYGQALIWIQKSSDAGNAAAQENLGWMYQNGFGVEKNYAKALALYQQSAAQNNLLAINNLGMFYQNGWGTSQDYGTALIWYQKAADQGNSAAQFSIGLMYSNGWGVSKDANKALSWLAKASDQGNPFAQFYIGSIYENGWGVPKNVDIAVVWYKKAAALGHNEATSALGSEFFLVKI